MAPYLKQYPPILKNKQLKFKIKTRLNKANTNSTLKYVINYLSFQDCKT